MKKLSFILSAFVAVSLASCGNYAEKASGDDSTQNADSLPVEAIVEDNAEATQGADSTEAIVIELSADEQVIPIDCPVVVDFNATWCGPCKQFAPTYHKVAKEYSDKATFASADVDVCEALAEKYNVSNIPCVVIIYPESANRQPVSIVGSLPEKDFKDFLDKNI